MKALQLDELPVEILHIISQSLDWTSLLALRLTNHVFANVYPSTSLERHRTRCVKDLFSAELQQLQKIEQDFWEAAEESFQGYHSSSYSSSSLDPDLRAHQERYQCLSNHLACYHCLRWLPSPTNEAGFSTQSCFSRGRSTLDFDLGGKKAQGRMCISCCVRLKIYPRESQLVFK